MSEQGRSWRVTSLVRHEHPAEAARRAGDRLLQLAAGLELGETVELRLRAGGDGKVAVNLTSTSRHPGLAELAGWVLESVAEVQESQLEASPTPERIVELARPTLRPGTALAHLMGDEPAPREPVKHLPRPLLDDGMALLKGLRETSAEVRLLLAPARELELDLAAHPLPFGDPHHDETTVMAYLGTPVEARLLAGFSGSLSPRVRGALLARGVGLTLTELDPEHPGTRRLWGGDPVSLIGSARPHGWAQCLTVIPVAGPVPVVCGLPTVARVAATVPVGEDVCVEGLRLGTATTAEGRPREVRIRADDLLLHTHVLGSTGSGKSSFLAGLVQEAIRAGIGVSLLDPHGHLVRRVLDEASVDVAERLTVVHSGNEARPVPINPLAGPNPELASDAIISVLRELHDPHNQGFLGPVFERHLNTLLSAQRAVLGSRANLALIPALALDQARLKKLADALVYTHREVAGEIRGLVSRTPSEFAETTAWVSAKFQRILNSAHLRAILGSGHDHIDVASVMDEGHSLLIDLAAPSLGDLSAQLLGELWLIKHWESLTQRTDSTQPHLLIVDEAHLFASGLLPRLLTQARKFGVGVVLAHQNLEQLTPQLREAVGSSTNNVVSFRTGHREAVAVHERLGTWAGGPLTRLPRLTAAVSLTSGSVFTEAFTLRVDHNERATATTPRAADEIVARSESRYALRDASQTLTFADIEAALRKPDTPPSFLDDWLQQRADRIQTSAAPASGRPVDE